MTIETAQTTDAAPALAVFPNAAVVQLISGDVLDEGAVVTELHGATVTVSDTAIAAVDGDFAWSWLLADLELVIHGANAPWTILVVPDIHDFGVSVPVVRVEEFRRLLSGHPGIEVRHQDGHLQGVWPPSAAPLAGGLVPLVINEATPSEPTSMVDAMSLLDTAPVPVIEPDEVLPAGVGNSSPAPAQKRLRIRDRQPHRAAVGPDAPPAALTGIDAHDISAWFASHQVLDRVSLEMPAGQVTALIGPSGCGKSTFLRILNRMHEMIPSASMAGEVLLDGHDVYDPDRKLTDARREIGMVFQKPNPFPAMSIYDNVLASLRLTGVKASTEVKDELVESCLTKAGLWKEVQDRLRKPGGGLSGGQQQRLCIARALAIRPRVLLMDEPCSALDPTSTRRIEETIMELVSEVTIVIVTHNMQQAARVSSRCAFFLAEHGTPGFIVEHGPTPAMFGSPQDPRTDDYVNGRFG